MNEAETVMRTHLFPGEKLLWSGRPRQGLVLRPIDMFLVPMTLGWVGFAILWQAKLLDLQKSAPFLSIVGIPFVVVVLYFLVVRFIMDAKKRANTCYGVTDGRIIYYVRHVLANPSVASLRYAPRSLDHPEHERPEHGRRGDDLVRNLALWSGHGRAARLSRFESKRPAAVRADPGRQIGI